MERGHVQHTKDGQRTTVNSTVDYVVSIFLNQMRNFNCKTITLKCNALNAPLILRMVYRINWLKIALFRYANTPTPPFFPIWSQLGP